MYALLYLTAITLTIPPAEKIFAISGGVYTLIQILKQSPRIAPYLKGWYAVALSAALSTVTTILTIPVDQLYTWNTLFAVIAALSGASGIHGIMWQAKNVPAPPELQKSLNGQRDGLTDVIYHPPNQEPKQ